MRILALDLGTKTIGVAMTDPLRIIAQAHETYLRRTMREDLAHIVDLIERFEIGEVVIGLPLSEDGAETAMSERVRSFAAQLSKKLKYTTRTGRRPSIVFWDERYSTQDAEELLLECRVQRSEHKAYIDKIAAAMILESYMRR